MSFINQSVDYLTFISVSSAPQENIYAEDFNDLTTYLNSETQKVMPESEAIC